MRKTPAPRDIDAASDQKALTEVENAQFLRILAKHHPKGPPTYKVSSKGIPTIFHQYVDMRGGSAAGLCADAI